MPDVGHKRSIMRIAVILLRLGNELHLLFSEALPDRQKQGFISFSRQSNTVTEDIDFLSRRLVELKPETNIVIITKRADKDFASMLEYAFVTLKSMYHLATASVCVLDSYWPAVSVLHHKKQLAVIQMWHAMGKIKKSGYQSLGKNSAAAT